MNTPQSFRSGSRRARGKRFLAASLAAALVALAGQAAGDAGSEAGEGLAGGGSEPARASSSFAESPAAWAPLGLQNADTLPKGSFAVEYRYQRIHYDDMRDKRHRVSSTEGLERFEEVPERRDTDIHWISLAYAPHRRVTVAAVLPIQTIETDSVGQIGAGPLMGFETRSSGIGDLEIRALVPFMRKGAESLHVEMGLSAPTGSISEKGRDSQGSRSRLPFPQQLGSGTVDLLPGIVYRGHHGSLSWGFVARGVMRAYNNSKKYRKGDQYQLSAWLAQTWTDWMSTSLRVAFDSRDNVHSQDGGSDNPERDAKRQGGRVLDVGPGVNFRIPFLGGPRMGVEMTWPVLRDSEGPQLEQDWKLTAGFRWAL